MGPSTYSCWAMDAPRGPQRPGLAMGSGRGRASGRAGQGVAGQPSPGGSGPRRKQASRGRRGPGRATSHTRLGALVTGHIVLPLQYDAFT
jgi:hypothetical protein